QQAGLAGPAGSAAAQLWLSRSKYSTNKRFAKNLCLVREIIEVELLGLNYCGSAMADP
ncbi:5396_t:CDS:2, partial [Ambispora leptoticha]